MRFFSSRKIFFSLINSFFFSIWTAKTSLRSVLTTIQISKKKELIAEKKKFLSEKKLRMRALPFQCNAFPATKKIYSSNNCAVWKTKVFRQQLRCWYGIYLPACRQICIQEENTNEGEFFPKWIYENGFVKKLYANLKHTISIEPNLAYFKANL